MANSWTHSESSARRFGGEPADYFPVHHFLDSSKAAYADIRHRALFHHSFGIFLVEQLLGPTVKLQSGLLVPTRLVAEQHIKEDCAGRIPTVQDWLQGVPLEHWLLAGARPLSRDLATRPDAPELPALGESLAWSAPAREVPDDV